MSAEVREGKSAAPVPAGMEEAVVSSTAAPAPSAPLRVSRGVSVDR
jgi:hypothetical protein